MIALATSASSAPSSIGRRCARAAPLRLAITAARISTASSPSRKTITAALVTAVAAVAPSPSAPAPSWSAWSSARRVSCTSRARLLLGDQRREPLLPVGAEPDQPLDPVDGVRRDRAQAQLGPELEERVGLEPRLLGRVRTGRRRRPPPSGRARSRSGRSRTGCRPASSRRAARGEHVAGALLGASIVSCAVTRVPSWRPSRSRAGASRIAEKRLVASGVALGEVLLEIGERRLPRRPRRPSTPGSRTRS